MPIYEYRCVCENEKEVRLSFEETNEPQVCDACGSSMKRKMSVSNFTMKPYGRQMAMDSLNSKSGGLPGNKPWIQRKVGEGL